MRERFPARIQGYGVGVEQAGEGLGEVLGLPAGGGDGDDEPGRSGGRPSQRPGAPQPPSPRPIGGEPLRERRVRRREAHRRESRRERDQPGRRQRVRRGSSRASLRRRSTMLPDGRCMREFLPAYARVRDSGGRTTAGALPPLSTWRTGSPCRAIISLHLPPKSARRRGCLSDGRAGAATGWGVHGQRGQRTQCVGTAARTCRLLRAGPPRGPVAGRDERRARRWPGLAPSPPAGPGTAGAAQPRLCGVGGRPPAGGRGGRGVGRQARSISRGGRCRGPVAFRGLPGGGHRWRRRGRTQRVGRAAERHCAGPRADFRNRVGGGKLRPLRRGLRVRSAGTACGRR